MKNLRKARLNKNLSKDQLAKMINCSTYTFPFIPFSYFCFSSLCSKCVITSDAQDDCDVIICYLCYADRIRRKHKPRVALARAWRYSLRGEQISWE